MHVQAFPVLPAELARSKASIWSCRRSRLKQALRAAPPIFFAAAMSKEEFAEVLDRCLEEFRHELLETYPVQAMAHAPTPKLDLPPELAHSTSLKAGASPNLLRAMKSGKSIDPTESENNALYHGDSAAVLGSGAWDLNPVEAAKVKNRLRLRLGATSSCKLVSGKSLLDAVVSLGLTTYQEEDMNEFVNHLADFISLRFQNERPSQLSVFKDFKDFGNSCKYEWSWPSQRPSQSAHLPRGITKGFAATADIRPTRTHNVVPAQALMDVFLSQDADVHKRIFGPRVTNQFRAMREILLAGDTNRLVAELTFVRINDLAAPPEPVHPLMYIEPLVAVLIVLNGIMIGFQTDPAYEDWSGWAYVDLTFQLCLLVEILFRMHLLRCRNYWWGPESYWNWFDLFLFASGLADVVLQFTGDKQSDMAATSLLRFCRLIRLVRIVKAE